MINQEKYLFQNCQKIVVFSKDRSSILLAKRKGEADYDGTFSFIGGKMETTDKDIIAGLEREKNEEIGTSCKLAICTDFNVIKYFRKKDGNYMVLPHYYAEYKTGDITLNDEYSEYKWIELSELASFEPKIATIPEVIEKLIRLRSILKDTDFIEI